MLNTTPTARRRAGLAAAAVVAGLAATLGLAAAAGAQTIPLLTFEADEGVGANAGGGVYGPFGATQGVRAFDFNNLASGNRTLFDIGTVNGDAPAGSPQLDNYEAFNSLNTALNSGKNGLLEFDLTIDDAGVMGPDATTSGEGFLQLGVFINSDAGFKGLGFGDLLGGNIGGVGTFPELGNAAVAGGVTLTILDPVNDAAGDTTFTARVSIPDRPQPHPELRRRRRRVARLRPVRLHPEQRLRRDDQPRHRQRRLAGSRTDEPRPARFGRRAAADAPPPRVRRRGLASRVGVARVVPVGDPASRRKPANFDGLAASGASATRVHSLLRSLRSRLNDRFSTTLSSPLKPNPESALGRIPGRTSDSDPSPTQGPASTGCETVYRNVVAATCP